MKPAASEWYSLDKKPYQTKILLGNKDGFVLSARVHKASKCDAKEDHYSVDGLGAGWMIPESTIKIVFTHYAIINPPEVE